MKYFKKLNDLWIVLGYYIWYDLIISYGYEKRLYLQISIDKIRKIEILVIISKRVK